MITSWLIANRFTTYVPDKGLLGRGGMGDVYRATDTQTGQQVAGAYYSESGIPNWWLDKDL